MTPERGGNVKARVRIRRHPTHNRSLAKKAALGGKEAQKNGRDPRNGGGTENVKTKSSDSSKKTFNPWGGGPSTNSDGKVYENQQHKKMEPSEKIFPGEVTKLLRRKQGVHPYTQKKKKREIVTVPMKKRGGGGKAAPGRDCVNNGGSEGVGNFVKEGLEKTWLQS